MVTEGRVTIGQLGDNNYGVWSKRMQALLESKNLWGIIEDEEDDKEQVQTSQGHTDALLGRLPPADGRRNRHR